MHVCNMRMTSRASACGKVRLGFQEKMAESFRGDKHACNNGWTEISVVQVTLKPCKHKPGGGLRPFCACMEGCAWKIVVVACDGLLLPTASLYVVADDKRATN